MSGVWIMLAGIAGGTLLRIAAQRYAKRQNDARINGTSAEE